MKYLLCIIAFVYAGLSAFAAAVQMKTAWKNDMPILMLCGAAILIAAAVVQLLFAWKYDFILAVVGGMMICAAAYINGERSGKLHISHHILRYLLTLALVVGFASIL